MSRADVTAMLSALAQAVGIKLTAETTDLYAD